MRHRNQRDVYAPQYDTMRQYDTDQHLNLNYSSGSLYRDMVSI